jgi:hypothetical protein
MSHLKTIQTSLKTIQEAYQKLESGELTMEELDQFVNVTQELLERALIIRYKAYENKISIAQTNDIAELNTSTDSDNGIQIEKTNLFETPEAVEIEEEKDEQPVDQFDAIIDENTDTSFSFDLFNDSAEAVQNETMEEEAVEHINISSTSHEENGIVEEHLLMEQIKRTPVEEENKMFIDQFSTIEANLFNQIGMSRLETLNNCFGLNEKFVYINELFKGSKDDFNDAIQQIDSDPSYHDALITASLYANKYNWDIESQTVNDFITKLKRRHG